MASRFQAVPRSQSLRVTPQNRIPRSWLTRKGRKSPNMRMLHPSLGHQSPEDREFGEWENYGWGQASKLTMYQIALCWKKNPRAREDLPEPLPFYGETSQVRGQRLGVSGRPGRIPCRMGFGRGNRWLQGRFLCCPGFCLPQKAILSFIFKLLV